ncbi:MAG TPA: glycoside hydrolase family 43 protein [Verrucomicrobiae bacterium]
MNQIQNPILPGFFPDPSICRAGDDFYIANSSFEWFPGVPIHHSKDLMNWQFFSHALTCKSQLDLRGVPDSAGVWAPSLSYADGRFWLIYTCLRNTGAGRPFKDLEIFLTTATDIAGPWSDPLELNSVGFDPSLFHDDDGRKWLVNMLWDFRKNRSRFAGIVIQEYDHQQQKLIGPMTKILDKPGILTEGPNLFKRDGWYYLMLAEGGTGWNHGISTARSRNLLGPYELDPQTSVLTSRDDMSLPLQKAGHGELVHTLAGEWYLVHLASRPLKTNSEKNTVSPDNSTSADMHIGDRCILGRETCLQRIEWNGGWLRIVGGGHHPKISWPAPAGLPVQTTPTVLARDHFDSLKLEPQWSVLRVPMDHSWLSLDERTGWLRLRGRDSLHSPFDQSLVARRVQHFKFIAETCLEFSPVNFMQSAGLVCYYDTRTNFYLRATHDESHGKILGVALTDDGVYDEIGVAETINDWRRIYLRAEVAGIDLQFSASPDAKSWKKIGPVLDFSKLSDDYGQGLHFTGAMVGLCAQDIAGQRLPADFDYFDYTPETP